MSERISIANEKLFESPDGNKTAFLMDDDLGASVVIGEEHHEIHRGRMYSSWYHVEGLADGGVKSILVTTGLKEIHLKKIDFWVNNAQVWAQIYEGPTATATNGTAFTPINKNRISTNSSTISIIDNAIYISSGTLIHYAIAGGGGSVPSGRSGGDGIIEDEIELLPSTVYVHKITNKSGASATVHLNLMWYEVT